MIVDQIIGLRGDVAMKAPVRAATIANITLSGLHIIDGVPIKDGDYVLVKDQINKKENGIYVANESGVWVRRADFNTKEDVVKGTMVYVQEGGINRGKNYMLYNDAPVNFDDDDIIFGIYSPDLSIFPPLLPTDKYKILEVDSTGTKYIVRDVLVPITITTATLLNETHRNKLVLCHTSLTVTLPLLSNSRGYVVYIENIDPINHVAIATSGSDKINGGLSSVTLKPSEVAMLVYNVGDWRLVMIDKSTFNKVYTKDIEIRDSTSMYVDSFLEASGGNIKYDRNIADNSIGVDTVYSTRFTNIIDSTAGSEDAQIIDQVIVNGTLTNALHLGNGLQVGAPVGAYKGTGTINAIEYYRNNYKLNEPAFSARLGSDVTLTPGVWTKIVCDIEEFDTNNMYSAGRFTPLVAGKYCLNLTLRCTSTANYAQQLALYFNGAYYKASVQDYVTSGTDNTVTLSVIETFNGTTDYVELFAMVTAGSPTVRGGHTLFSGHLIHAG